MCVCVRGSLCLQLSVVVSHANERTDLFADAAHQLAPQITLKQAREERVGAVVIGLHTERAPVLREADRVLDARGGHLHRALEHQVAAVL